MGVVLELLGGMSKAALACLRYDLLWSRVKVIVCIPGLYARISQGGLNGEQEDLPRRHNRR